MLSILIPTYNYNVVPLVCELKKQIDELKIEYEILVQDDCSSNFEIINQNNKINDFEHTTFFYNEVNFGRGKNINSLVKKANFNWLLVMDCDLFPVDSHFISNYLNAIQSNNSSFYYGGIMYESEKPKDEEMLRWVFGNKREAIPLSIRQKDKYRFALTSNILVEKSILIQIPFNSLLTKYGFEDLVLILELKNKNIDIQHIENPLYHLNLERSMIFIEKYQCSLENLKFLLDSKIISPKSTRIDFVKGKIDFFPINFILISLYKLFRKPILKNLTSKKPKLFLFDFYRLGYFLNLYHSK
jgi:glycosyltransferase involved in cell wall biosynthesis